MSSGFMRPLLRRGWWWVSSILIAGPALVLALFGLRAIRVDRIEREQQLREQQTQVARLADAAITNAIERMIAQLDRMGIDSFAQPARPSLEQADLGVFILDAGDVLSFPRQRIYFGRIGQKPGFLRIPGHLSPAASRLISEAQAMEAQQRRAEAIRLYRQARLNPLLKDWASLALDRLEEQASALSRVQRLANPSRGQSEVYTPAGVPVAIVASSAVEQVGAQDRSRFTPLLEQTLGSLRENVWWLSYEQRRAYDAELQRWLHLAGASVPATNDTRLEELAPTEQAIRRASHYSRNAPRLETQGGQSSFIVWSRAPRDSAAIGAALWGSALQAVLDSALQPLFHGQPFTAALRRADGLLLWNRLPDAATPWRTEQLGAVQDLQLDFTGPQEAWMERNRWMWYGFVLLPLLMLLVGLVMTVQVVRQEVALNQMQAKFVAAVSHELKSPITGIRLLMERISDGRLHAPGTAREYYAAIGRETDRLENLVNRLLESQKIQSEGRTYAFELSSLGDLADHAVQRLRPQAEAKGIRLAAQADAGIPDLRLDKAAIGDAIENLLDNAIKYSSSGTEVSIHIRSTDNEARVEVCDHGIGIEKADLPRIFDPFYRGRRGDMESVKGTGLGLALVKAAAEAHGGAVDVSSAPDGGSRFTLRLPIAEGT
jgi:signal transduction histidine kinase